MYPSTFKHVFLSFEVNHRWDFLPPSTIKDRYRIRKQNMNKMSAQTLATTSRATTVYLSKWQTKLQYCLISTVCQMIIKLRDWLDYVLPVNIFQVILRFKSGKIDKIWVTGIFQLSAFLYLYKCDLKQTLTQVPKVDKQNKMRQKCQVGNLFTEGKFAYFDIAYKGQRSESLCSMWWLEQFSVICSQMESEEF